MSEQVAHLVELLLIQISSHMLIPNSDSDPVSIGSSQLYLEVEVPRHPRPIDWGPLDGGRPQRVRPPHRSPHHEVGVQRVPAHLAVVPPQSLMAWNFPKIVI